VSSAWAEYALRPLWLKPVFMIPVSVVTAYGLSRMERIPFRGARRSHPLA
jgi:hypothetical protein